MDAFGGLKNMEDDRYKPDGFTYRVLIDALCKLDSARVI